MVTLIFVLSLFYWSIYELKKNVMIFSLIFKMYENVQDNIIKQVTTKNVIYFNNKNVIKPYHGIFLNRIPILVTKLQ